MQNFTYHNPVKIVFGKGTIAELGKLVPAAGNIMLTYGGGSIKQNGVYDQVMRALQGRYLIEFGGIEPNPTYETLMQAVELGRAGKIDFILAVGGGSVLDGTKFISAAIPYTGPEPWDIVAHGAKVATVVPWGDVLTLPATGSEMNQNAVISRKATVEKLAFGRSNLYPVFSILDPETTYTLPPRQVGNGIVDAFVHVTEQYLTYPAQAPLQNRQAEAILSTLIEIGPRALQNPPDYDARATLVWSATQALNGLINRGVPEDWATHMIGHELTALYGLDHAQTLAIVLPGVLKNRRRQKWQKILLYGERVWGLRAGSEDVRVDAAIDLTAAFFRSVGVPTTLTAYGIGSDAPKRVGERLDRRGATLGECGDIRGPEAEAILNLCYA
jgi:NADP-dependent alcohol dehydrogenase